MQTASVWYPSPSRYQKSGLENIGNRWKIFATKWQVHDSAMLLPLWVHSPSHNSGSSDKLRSQVRGKITKVRSPKTWKNTKQNSQCTKELMGLWSPPGFHHQQASENRMRGGKKTGRRPLNYAGCSSWKCIAATLCKCPTHVQHFRRHSFSPSVSLQQRSTKFTQLPWCIIYDASRNQLSSTTDVKSKQAGRTHLFFTRWHVSTTTGEPSAGSTCASLVKGLE